MVGRPRLASNLDLGRMTERGLFGCLALLWVSSSSTPLVSSPLSLLLPPLPDSAQRLQLLLGSVNGVLILSEESCLYSYI